MGIRKLTSFVQNEFTGWRRNVVQGKLIIDGFSLCHALFDEHLSDHDYLLGGDYVSFAKYIEKFFSTLEHNKIEPFVIFDGTDFDLKKKRTYEDRRRHDAEVVMKLLYAPDTVYDNEHVLPQLSHDVMIHTTKSVLGDEHFYVADGDADVDIASLAISHKCPVLSADSDFYVFPLTHGYIPYSKFYWHKTDTAGAVIYGTFFYCEAFAKEFNITDQRLLALLPAFAGNDAIPPLDKDIVSKIVPVCQNSFIGAIIYYVADFKTLEECKESLLRQEIIDPTILIKNLETAFQDYFILSQVDYSGLRAALKHKNDSHLPKFVFENIRTGAYSRLIGDVLFLQEVDLKVTLEDMPSQNWCHLIGLPIRRAIYGILCGGGATIQELQRHDKSSTEFSNKSIQALTSISYHSNQISLPSLYSLGADHEVDSAQKILYAVLECSGKDFRKLSKDYRLLMAITHYWHINCTIKAKTIFLQSFLLFLKQPNKELEAIMKEGKVEFSFASFVHAVSQWQSLYNNVHCLNQLLQQPLPLPEPSEFLECSNLYSYTIAVAQEGVSQVIQQNSLDKDAYEAFFAVTHTVVDEPMPKMVTPTSNTHTDSSRAPDVSSVISPYSCRNRFASLSTD